MALSLARSRTLAAVSLTAVAVLGTAATAVASPAHADRKKPKPPIFLTIVYQAAGTSHIAKPDSTISVGPTTLTSTLNNNDDTITGSLPLPPTTSTFKALGLLPVAATVTFVPNGGVTGKLNVASTGTTVTSKASYFIQLSNVTVAGVAAGVGDTCITAAPVEIDAATPAGQTFDVFNGGNLTANYTLGDFANCGLTTALINALVPGPNNTLALVLSDGQLQLPPAS